ncbi:MAG TPA: hypothetical protein VFR70_07030 [Flavobacterium sp.]|nr:hypothetical protein [Flavobacterium sp.]
MKKNILKNVLRVFSFLLAITAINARAQVGIGTTAPNAALDITSANEGVLIPRVALTSTNIVAPVITPQASELVYNTATVNDVTPGFYYLNPTATGWIRLATGANVSSGWNLAGNTDTNPTANFLGTADNQDLSIRTFGSEKIRVASGGNVGIGTNSPAQKLTVSGGNIGLDNQGIVTAKNTGGTYENVLYGRWVNNATYLDGGVGGTYLRTNNGTVENQFLSTNGNTGIGTNTPAYKLDVAGTTKTNGFVMPTGAVAGAVLTADASGNGTWQTSSISNVVGVVGGSGVDIAYNTTQYVYTGNYIILPPGRYAVNVSMLMTVQSGGVTFVTPANSSFWLRSTFADNFTFPNQSFDIQGGHLASGLLAGSSFFGLINGTIIINNTSGASKIYYYTAGNCAAYNTTQTISGFGSSANFENRIIAYKIN